MFLDHGGAAKIEELTSTLEKVTKERVGLHQELSKPNALRARLAEARQTIKKLKRLGRAK